MSAAFLAALLLAAQAWSAHPAIAEVRLASPVPPVIPVKRSVVPTAREELGPIVSAASAVAMDAETGAILFGKRGADVRPLASITKLVTAMVVADAGVWDHVIAIDPDDIPAEGHTVFTAGDRVSVRDLFATLLVGSDNGAARALARGIGGGTEEFLARMQVVAASAGPTFRIADPAGLLPGNIASAVDVARLARLAFARPEIRAYATRPSVTVNGRRHGRERLLVRATNVLVRDGIRTSFRIVGAKTGYIDESGYNLTFDVVRDGHRVIVVALGSPTSDDRFRDARVLADWTFRNYVWNSSTSSSDSGTSASPR
ncbi:D-alanyl-D-alanine carboxypeptidase [Candidatus Uhrbacteria bacterium]|nr:D-alanyl-D-alanine carboxypeptidase [Candidatus Uhrbacteria bacterium]